MCCISDVYAQFANFTQRKPCLLYEVCAKIADMIEPSIWTPMGCKNPFSKACQRQLLFGYAIYFRQILIYFQDHIFFFHLITGI